MFGTKGKAPRQAHSYDFLTLRFETVADDIGPLNELGAQGYAVVAEVGGTLILQRQFEAKVPVVIHTR